MMHGELRTIVFEHIQPEAVGECQGVVNPNGELVQYSIS